MGLEVFGILLDISKVLDKAWHDRLIDDRRQNNIFGKMINILHGFLIDRKQRIILNNQCSSCADIHFGVPQGIKWYPK